MNKLDRLWEVLESNPSRVKLEQAMKQAGYTPAEIMELEDGDPELGRWLTRVFRDLKRSIRSRKRFKRFISSEDCKHLLLLRNKADHIALTSLFIQYKIDWERLEDVD